MDEWKSTAEMQAIETGTIGLDAGWCQSSSFSDGGGVGFFRFLAPAKKKPRDVIRAVAYTGPRGHG